MENKSRAGSNEKAKVHRRPSSLAFAGPAFPAASRRCGRGRRLRRQAAQRASGIGIRTPVRRQVEPASSCRRASIFDVRRKVRRRVELGRCVAGLSCRRRQRQPGREEEQVRPMILAIPSARARLHALQVRPSVPAGERGDEALGGGGRPFQQGERRAQGRRASTPVRASSCASSAIFAGQFLHEAHRVAQAGKNLRRENAHVGQFPQARAEREQVPRKVAAVHAGNIERQQRLAGCACHTSCRSARGTVRGAAWCRRRRCVRRSNRPTDR